MDKTPKYILMCEKATEIQKTWKPQRWDLTSEVNNFDDDCIWAVLPDSIADGGWYGCSEDNVEEYKQYRDNKKFIWLPRQDQLQDMIDSSCTLNLIGLFDDWLSGECFQPDVPATVFKDMYEGASMEMLWLSFVMDRNFQKIWSGESEGWKIKREEKTLQRR